MTNAVEAVSLAIRDVTSLPHSKNEPGQAAIDTLTALNWLPPEAVERLLKHQHDIIGAQATSLEKAELEVERLSAAIPPEAVAAVKRAALERAAKIASSLTPMPPNPAYASYLYTRHVQGVEIAAAILALAPSNSTWQEVKEGYVMVPESDKRIADAVKECKDDTWQCPKCGHSETWWSESNADFASRAMIKAGEKP